jgi:hypothetical protein
MEIKVILRSLIIIIMTFFIFCCQKGTYGIQIYEKCKLSNEIIDLNEIIDTLNKNHIVLFSDSLSKLLLSKKEIYGEWIIEKEEYYWGEFFYYDKNLKINTFISFTKNGQSIDCVSFKFFEKIKDRNIFYSNSFFEGDNLLVISTLDTSKVIHHPSQGKVLTTDKWVINNKGYFTKID